MVTTIQGCNMQTTYPGAYDRWNKHDCWYMAKEAE